MEFALCRKWWSSGLSRSTPRMGFRSEWAFEAKPGILHSCAVSGLLMASMSALDAYPFMQSAHMAQEQSQESEAILAAWKAFLGNSRTSGYCT
jgi:hypothetical protein